jgi:hypothetical protein
VLDQYRKTHLYKHEGHPMDVLDLTGAGAKIYSCM